MENKQDIYASFSGLLMAFGGMIGGAVVWLAVFNGEPSALPYCLMLGWLLGLPAAWLTARSARKRGWRRGWRGCLKTVAFGAWWGAATTGGLVLLVVSYFLFTIPNFDPHPLATATITDWIDFAIRAGLVVALSSVCGAVAAGILSLGLPKAEPPK